MSLNPFVNMKKNICRILLVATVLILCQPLMAQTGPGTEAPGGSPFDLKGCVGYALRNNEKLCKDKLGLETARQSRREIIGALLPQISGQAGLTRNIDKTTIAMPNFVNSMMPEPMRDPNAPKYMTVTMGMDWTANWGAAIAQQLVNFSLFNAVKIADAADEMAKLGVEASTEDIISQTALIYYNAQVLEYALGKFDESLELMSKTLRMLEINRDNGLVRSVDVGQVQVQKTNLETEKLGLERALEVQKNLLKLQMGFPMEDAITLQPIDLDAVESMVLSKSAKGLEVESQTPFRLLKNQQDMLGLQVKAAKYELLPVLNLTANYSMNYMGDQFKGETFHKFPMSMVSLNLRVPIFGGFSKDAKIKKAQIELQKARFDEKALTQALSMAYSNSLMQLDQTRKTIDTQHRNKELAQEVFDVTENNYNEGISSLSDLLNASSSLIKSQMNYVSALGDSIKAYIDLKKAEGTIRDLQ